MNFCRYFNEKSPWNSDSITIPSNGEMNFILATNQQTNERIKCGMSCVVLVCVDLASFLVCLELPCQSLWIWHHYCVIVCIPRYSLNMRSRWINNQRQRLWADTFDIVIFAFSLKSKLSNLELVNKKISFVAFTLSRSLSTPSLLAQSFNSIENRF